MIPEYTRAGCSILGAWGKATANNHLIQLRALDWDNNNPLNKYPIIKDNNWLNDIYLSKNYRIK